MHADQLAKYLVAHRGYQRRYPENTLLALQQAVAQGVTRLDFDIQLTADHVPVLYHDLDLSRTSSVHHKITNLTWAQLQRYGASEKKRFGYIFHAEPIPTLQSVIDWVSTQSELNLFVELKKESIAEFGVDAVLDAVLPLLGPVSERAILTSFNHELIAEVSRRGGQTGLVVRSWPPSKAVLAYTCPTVIFVNKRRVMPGRRLDRLGIPVVVYEIDTVKRAARWLRRGASMLETFSCGELLDGWRDLHG